MSASHSSMGRKARKISLREKKGFARVIEYYGTRRKLAAEMGVTEQAVANWFRYGLPAHQVIPVSRATGIPKAELRPDLFG